MPDLKPWRTLHTKLLLDCAPWLRVYSEKVELPDGRVVNDYLRLEQPDFVMIVPVRSGGEIGLIRCYKHGVGAVDMQPPAGYIEPDEDVLITAQRELLEETGCQAESCFELGSYVISGNRGTGRAHLYLATGCQQVVEPDAGDLEEQEVVWLSLEEVRRRWTDGKFSQIVTAAALGLALNRLGIEDIDPP